MRHLLPALLLCLPSPGLAETRRAAPMMLAPGRNAGGPLIFARENVFITAKKNMVGADEASTEQERRKYYFDTDIKPEAGLGIDWFYSLQDIRPGRATLIVLAETGPIALPEAKLYKPVDILVIGADGSILAVMPEIRLATLEKRVKLDLPVRALMYLGGGEAKSLGIAPKDRLVHRLFTADPVVIQ